MIQMLQLIHGLKINGIFISIIELFENESMNEAINRVFDQKSER